MSEMELTGTQPVETNQNVMDQNEINQNMMDQNIMDQNIMDQNMMNQNMMNQNMMDPYQMNYGMEKQKHLGQKLLSALIYAVFFTFCIYKNYSGITTPFLAAATVAYAMYCFKLYEIEMKKDSYFHIAVIILLGGSSFLTGSGPIIFFNTIGMGLMLLCMMLHNFYNDEHWNLAKYFGAIFRSFFGTVSVLDAPARDVSEYNKANKKTSGIIYVLIGIAIALPILTVIITLLYSADVIFAVAIDKVLVNINIANILGIGFTFLFGFFAAYCGVKYISKKRISEAVKDTRNHEPVIAITVLSLIALVYVFFSVTQFMYFFIGDMTVPDGYTYASYVHEGFWQLLFVCMLNVSIVLTTMKHFRKHAAIKVLLTIISICTYIILASSALRLSLYVKRYSFTFLRVLVLWSLIVIALLLTGILVQIFKEEFKLFRYSLVVICSCYLVLSFAHVDYYIAKFNLEYVAENEGEVDYEYLSELSSDAAPAFADCDAYWVREYKIRQHEYRNEGIRKFNLSHYMANKLLNSYKN